MFAYRADAERKRDAQQSAQNELRVIRSDYWEG